MSVTTSKEEVEKVLEEFGKTTEEIITSDELKKMLLSGKKLRIKYGVDVTSPGLHLGHAVSLWLLRCLQDLGHTVIFLIGDYTTKIGDPSGRSTTRPILSDEQIKENAKTYFDQVGKILDTQKVEVRYNSEWFSKMTFNDILQLAGKFTVAQIIERDDFQKRLTSGLDIGMHELIYPLMQAYDSVMLKADIEFGGSDQKFNLLAGRALQKKMGQDPQVVVMVKLLVGLDGKEKMSKSLGNYIGIIDEPKEMFGKVMSIPDSLMIEYFRLATDLTSEKIAKVKEELEKGANPRDIKLRLAGEIVKRYYNEKTAIEEKERFLKTFSERQIPEDLPTISVEEKELAVYSLLKECLEELSGSEIRRLIDQKAINIDDRIVSDPNEIIAIPKEGAVVKVGKRRWFKVVSE